MAKQKDNIIIRIRKFEKEYQELLKKYGLDPAVQIEFPMYRELPEELQLALSVIKKHNPVYKLYYIDKWKLSEK